MERSGGTHLRSVNLNLLPVLEAVLSSRSVTASATKLHMSQSAVSDALARLRAQFGDELLIRSGRQMLLTPLAEQILPAVQEIIGRIDVLVTARRFSPADLDREFVIATADPVVMAFGSGLFHRMQTQAPRSSVRFVDLEVRDYQRLRSLELDLVILPRGYLRRERLIEQPLYRERFVCIARAGHPAIDGKLSRALYSRLPHVAYRSDQRSTVSMDARLLKLEQRDVILVPNFSLLPLIVEQTDAIALVQRRVAERLAATAAIELHEPPEPIPPLDVCMYWSVGHDPDPAHRWLRETMRALADAL
ncbi:MAG: LysR family transcriptional regulator [Pseudomonadales bacterium]|nr:LysR family transcriptional regulator [Pseudomonadales bacterium]